MYGLSAVTLVLASLSAWIIQRRIRGKHSPLATSEASLVGHSGKEMNGSADANGDAMYDDLPVKLESSTPQSEVVSPSLEEAAQLSRIDKNIRL